MKNRLFRVMFVLAFLVAIPYAALSVDTAALLKKLVDGNNRFVSGKSIHPNISADRIKSIADGQNPFAIIVSCSDSRVCPEIAFDQGLGDLFVVRTAGNVIGDLEKGTIEYAVTKLKCHLIVVLGHEKCGAVEAFLKSNNKLLNNHIDSVLKLIKANINLKSIECDKKKNLSELIRANVCGCIKELKESEPILKKASSDKKLLIIGAIYDMNTGKITFDKKK